jgi:hypothetical protein
MRSSTQETRGCSSGTSLCTGDACSSKVPRPLRALVVAVRAKLALA